MKQQLGKDSFPFELCKQRFKLSTSMKQHHLFWLAPIFLVIIVSELIYVYKEHKTADFWKDCKRNTLIGIVLFGLGFISQLLMFYSFKFMYQFKFLTLHRSWWVWLLNFIISDFAYYCYHRTAHKVNWFWMSHQVHHSSEHYNLTVAFRQSWMEKFSGEFLFWLWIPLLGIDPVMMMLNYQFTRFYQGLLHTEKLQRLPKIIEFIFNTPSHHRVHHASNKQYIDKNHGGVLIVWDRLFKTFCKENEKPVYGLTEKGNYNDVISIMFTGWRHLIKKIAGAENMRARLKYLTQSPAID